MEPIAYNSLWACRGKLRSAMRAAQKEKTSLVHPLGPRSNARKRVFSPAGASEIAKSFLSRVERDLPIEKRFMELVLLSGAARSTAQANVLQLILRLRQHCNAA